MKIGTSPFPGFTLIIVAPLPMTPIPARSGWRKCMALLTWNSKYSVGVKTLDSQHTVLFGILNDLHAAMLKGQAQSLTGPLLRKLVDYTQTHFSTEERMLTEARYPGLADHKVKHSEL